MSVLLCVVYFAVLLALSAYGFHRMHLVILCRRHERALRDVPRLAGPPKPDDELPLVTIQLPIFNESTVVARLLESTAAIDYPKDKLQIQVLDDSTDETRRLAERQVESLRRRGFDAEHIHRVDRTGYKAGALDAALPRVKGELVAIFDADFIPTPDFARALVGHFDDPEVGMVQARWAHLNRDVSLLTRVQALMLDGHHMVENRARFGAGFLFNFSGTGGMWRKSAIADAGGWAHDTLTEDLDLSYRAQLKGWKFIYRPDVVSPAELPEDVSALRAQQYRWAKGTVQTARKLFRRIWRSDLTRGQKLEAFFHLTPHFAYPLMLLLTFLLLPVLLCVDVSNWQTALAFDVPLCMAPMSSLAAFYMLADTAQGRSRWKAIKILPVLIALGAGLAPHLTKAVWDGWRTRAGEFVRTPKRGTNRFRYSIRAALPLPEMLFALLCTTAAVVSVVTGHTFATPFTCLFAFGSIYIATLIVLEQRRAAQSAPVADAPTVAAADEAVIGDLAA